MNIGIGRVIEGMHSPLFFLHEIELRCGVKWFTDKLIGWDQGVLQMSLGEKAILTISRYAYYSPPLFFFVFFMCLSYNEFMLIITVTLLTVLGSSHPIPLP